MVAVHSTQVRVVIEQTNGAAQSVSPRHCTQRFAPSVVSQRRVGIAQSASPAHAVALSQRPTPATTSTHVWPDGHPLRAGPQPGVQKPFGPLQITPDVGPPHAVSPATPSQPHCPVAGRHCGWTPPHSAPLVDEHSVHEPASGPAAWQAGRAGSAQVGAPSPAQATHACVAGEQTGVAPPQSALAMQPTHTPPPPVVSQSGVAAEQRLVSVGVQTAQAPVLRQTGNLGSQSALSRQPRHVREVASHTGRTPAQSAPEAHSTHALVVGSQTLPAEAHAPGLPAAQATQRPPAPQTGVEAPQSVSATHGRQV